jgi:hypothetical protein
MLAVSFIASSAAFQAGHFIPQAPAAARVSSPEMFTGKARAAPKRSVRAPAKKAPVKKAAAAGGKGLFSSGVAPAAAKTTSKAAISSKSTVQSYIDVTGKEYQEVNTFVPQYDEIGVLPPLGRWDPLQIREQVRNAFAARLLRAWPCGNALELRNGTPRQLSKHGCGARSLAASGKAAR